MKAGEPMRWRAGVAAPPVHDLAEGPYWDAWRERLLWVDITAGTVHEGRVAGEHVIATGSRVLDRTVGAVVCGRTGDMLVAGTESLLVVDATGEVSPGPRILPPGSGRRLNDGACDPDGVFLVGSLHFDGRRGGEVLVRVGPDRRVTTIDEGLTLSNGLGWSPDRRLFYSIDSTPGTVYVRDYGSTARRVLIEPGGTPDGMCVDAAGNLWIAIWGAGEVRRYDPAGRLTGIVEVDAPNVTSAVFAGPELDRLFITTARSAGHPDSGRLFCADVGTTGLAPTPWAGFD